MSSLKPQRNLRIDDELYLKLKYIADESSRSFNKQAEYVLKKFVKEYEAKHGEIIVDTDELYK